MLQRVLTHSACLVYYSSIMSNIKDLTVLQLKRAVEIMEQIESLQAQFASIGGGRRGRPAATRAGKRRQAPHVGRGPRSNPAAARARWAKYRRGATKAKPAKAAKGNVSAPPPGQIERRRQGPLGQGQSRRKKRALGSHPAASALKAGPSGVSRKSRVTPAVSLARGSRACHCGCFGLMTESMTPFSYSSHVGDIPRSFPAIFANVSMT